MPESSNQNPAAAPPPPAKRRRLRRHARHMGGLVFLGILLAIALLLWKPTGAINRTLAFTNGSTWVQRARWKGISALELEGVRYRKAVQVERLQLRWSWPALLFHRKIAEVEIQGVRLIAAELTAEQVAAAPNAGNRPDPTPATSHSGNAASATTPTTTAADASSAPASAPPSAAQDPMPLGVAWTIGRLQVTNGLLLIDKLGPGIPPLTVRFGSPLAIQWKDVVLGKHGSAAEHAPPQSLAVHDLVIYSPYDALAPVLSFAQIRIDFYWEELLAQRLRRVTVTGPTLYLGPDLFWFADEFQRQKPPTAGSSATSTGAPLPAWQIDGMEVKAGRLAVNVTGQPSVVFPFYFHSRARAVRLDKIEEIVLKNEFIVDDQTLEYPSYGLGIEHLNGKIEFSLPLAQHRPRNVVPTLRAAAVVWKGARVTEPWLSVTFDRDGIYGQIGGRSYGGYISGQFEMAFAGGFPWKGYLFAKQVDLGPAAQLWAGEHLALTGSVNGKAQVHGLAREVQSGVAAFEFVKPGVFEWTGAQEIAQKLPADWPALKRELARVGLDAIRRMDFTSGTLRLEYGIPVSTARLDIQSTQGRRTFDLTWEQAGAPSAGQRLQESMAEALPTPLKSDN